MHLARSAEDPQYRIGQRSRADEDLHGQLVNWGRAFRGGLPNLSLSCRDHAHGDSYVLADALVVEAVMCRLKRERFRLWRLMELRYIRLANRDAERQALGTRRRPLCERQLRALAEQAFRWLRIVGGL